MTEIVDAIGSFIEEFLSEDISPAPVKNWGLCELAVRTSKGTKNTSDQPIAMTINGTGQREQVSLDDRYSVIFWIRLNSPVRQRRSEEDDWGLQEGKRSVLGLRIVVAHKVTLGEDLIFRLANALPDKLILTGYDLVFINADGSIDVDHPTIYETELGKTVYEHHIFDWNLYVLNLDVEFKLCRQDVTILTDDLGKALIE